MCLRVHPSDDNMLGVYAKRFLQVEGRNAHFASALFYTLDVLHSLLRYGWFCVDYTVFVRYLLGTAYLPSPLDKVAYHFFSALLPKPEKAFFIDVEPEVAYNRIVKRAHGAREMFENTASLRKIRRKGLALAKLGKWQIVDGAREPSEVELCIRRSLSLK